MMISIAMEQRSNFPPDKIHSKANQPQGSEVYISRIYSQHYMNKEKL